MLHVRPTIEAHQQPNEAIRVLVFDVVAQQQTLALQYGLLWILLTHRHPTSASVSDCDHQTDGLGPDLLLVTSLPTNETLLQW